MRRVFTGPLIVAAVLILYLAAGSLALEFGAHPQNIAYFWPAAGISAGTLIVCPRALRAPVAAAVFIAVLIANGLQGVALAPALIFALTNTAEALLCAAIIWRVRGSLPLLSLRDVNLLLPAAGLAAVLAACATMALLALTSGSTPPPASLIRVWAMADFAGILSITPLVLTLASDRLPKLDAPFREGILALTVLGIVAFVGYRQDPAAPRWTDLTAFSAMLPVLVWITARAPRQIAAAAPALVALIMVWVTVKGYGPYSHPEYPTDQRILAAQMELVIFAVIALYLSALFGAYRTALQDVSDGRAALEARFVELEALYAEAPLGLGMLDTSLRFVRINEALAEMNGFSANQHIGRSVWDLVPALRSEAEPVLRHVLETGEPLRDVEIHGVTAARPGQMREWCEQFYPIKANGAVIGVGIVCEDVTEKRRAQDRERLLSREVDHRAKNLLAVVHSIVQLSGAEDVASYRHAISSRIQSLARTHSLLAGSRWEGASLATLANEELAPFLRFGQIRIEGTDVQLTPSATQDIALLLHELATNAAKYGALSTKEGQLAVLWEIKESSDGALLHLSWLETSGPPVRSPAQQGFGSALVEATLTGQLKGRSDFDWREEGLHARLVFPLAEVSSSGSSKRNSSVAADDDPVGEALLSGRRILLIEDEPLIGLHAQNCLEDVGFSVIGPVARIEPALAAARSAEIDFAILDINLAGHMTFEVGDILMARGIPFAFCSGYSAPGDIPDRFAGVLVLRKPLSEAALIAAVAPLAPPDENAG